jgi:serine/threonine-protein kinase
MILGTAAYMSPEQAKGRPVDRRADVWAFGAVLFEMLSGRRAFEGDDVSEVLASVLKSEPEWTALPSDLPGPVRRLLRRCLEKDPKRRLRDVAEGMLQLEEGLATGATSSMMMPAASGTSGVTMFAAPAPWWRRALPIAAAVVVTALVLVGVQAWTAVLPEEQTPVRFQHQITTGRLWISQNFRDVGVSPDGKTIVFATTDNPGSAGPALWARRLDQIEATPLRGGEGGGNPFVSPDNQWVGFISAAGGTDVKKVSIHGGPPVDLFRTQSSVFGATWLDTSIVFSVRGQPLFIVGEGSGTPVALTTLDADAGEVEHLLPSAVPGTGVVLFVAGKGTTVALGGELAAFDRTSGRTVRLKIAGIHPRYVPTGHIVYATADGVLRALAFDPATLETSGTPVPVLNGIGIKGSGAANFDVALDGRIVYAGGLEGLSAARSITWVDRTGRETPIGVPPRNYYYVRLSPDEAYLSLDARDQQEDIWIWDLRRESPSRLTDKPGADQYGLWMPKGMVGVVFNSAAGPRSELYRMRPDGTGEMDQLTDTSAERLVPFPNAITPDGAQVIFRAASTSSKNDLWIASMTGPKTVRKLLAGPHHELNAALSPDGKWMAYESDYSGRTEVYVRPFPDVNAEQFSVSVAGGAEPVWARNEIFFIADNKLMAVRVSTTAGFVAEKPVELFDVSAYYFGGQGRNYDVAADGRRFVMVKDPPAVRNQTFPINVILNWTHELRSLVK